MTINRELIKQLLRAAFPDPAVEILDDAIDGAVGAMERAWRPEIEHFFGIPRPADAPGDVSAPASDDPRVTGYYLAHARHARISGDGKHAFTGFLPMVSLTLPEKPDDIQTRMGWAYAGDRKMHSLADVRAYLAEVKAHFGSAPRALDRVELLTPPRLAQSRFGAIAVYVLHPEGAIVEAGMATGQPRVLFWLPTMGEWHVRRSWYKPTPDSSPDHFYKAKLSVDGDRRAARLEILRFNADPRQPEFAALAPTMQIVARFERHAQPIIEFPGALLFQAACRVAAVQQQLGKELPDVGFLTPLLAEIAKTFEWEDKP